MIKTKSIECNFSGKEINPYMKYIREIKNAKTKTLFKIVIILYKGLYLTAL